MDFRAMILEQMGFPEQLFRVCPELAAHYLRCLVESQDATSHPSSPDANYVVVVNGKTFLRVRQDELGRIGAQYFAAKYPYYELAYDRKWNVKPEGFPNARLTKKMYFATTERPLVRAIRAAKLNLAECTIVCPSHKQLDGQRLARMATRIRLRRDAEEACRSKRRNRNQRQEYNYKRA